MQIKTLYFKDPYSNRFSLPRALPIDCSQMPNAENFQNYFSFSQFKQMLCLVLVKQLNEQYPRDNCQMWVFFSRKGFPQASDSHRTWTMHADQLVEDAHLKKVVSSFCQECDTSLPWEQPGPWHWLQPVPAGSATRQHSTSCRGSCQQLLPEHVKRPLKSTKEMAVLRSQHLHTGQHST